MRRARRGLAVVLATMLAAGVPSPAQAYLKLGTTVAGRSVQLRWERTPVRYFVTDRGVPGVTAAQFQTTVARAFQTWQDLETSTFTSTFVGFTSATPLVDDGMTVLGYLPRPDLPRVLGATTFLINNQTGEILEADIFFNSSFPWSVAASGEAGRFDLESIALHEIGHLLGLGHSALGETELRPTGGRRVIASEAVMFPIAFAAGNIQERSPRTDDIAGAADIYPETGFRSRTGSINGRVTKSGRGVFGAHVVAWNPRTGSLIGGFTLDNDGKFVIAGLEPGPHVLRVEPLDDGDVESFLDDASRVDVDFGAAFSSALVVAPRGGTSREVEIRVNPK
jgi:hypothetical protein